MMQEETFWEFIDEAREESGNDEERFLEALERGLMELPPNAIEGFRERLDDVLARAYRWDLWAVAYIINGGASDDGFQYFRAWLISRGQRVFEQALKDPRGLETFVPTTPSGRPSSKKCCIYLCTCSSKKPATRCPFPSRSRPLRKSKSSSLRASPGTKQRWTSSIPDWPGRRRRDSRNREPNVR